MCLLVARTENLVNIFTFLSDPRDALLQLCFYSWDTLQVWKHIHGRAHEVGEGLSPRSLCRHGRACVSQLEELHLRWAQN